MEEPLSRIAEMHWGGMLLVEQWAALAVLVPGLVVEIWLAPVCWKLWEALTGLRSDKVQQLAQTKE